MDEVDFHCIDSGVSRNCTDFLMRYAGTAIDGPMRGQNIVSDTRWYPVHITPPLCCMDFNFVPPDKMEPPKRFYRWSHSLSQWCLEY